MLRGRDEVDAVLVLYPFQGHILLVPLRFVALVSVVPARRVMEAPILLVMEPNVYA